MWYSIIERRYIWRIKILADICKEYNCKVVIEASAKDAIDEEVLLHTHKVKVGKVLRKGNDIKRLLLKRSNEHKESIWIENIITGIVLFFYWLIKKSQ